MAKKVARIRSGEEWDQPVHYKCKKANCPTCRRMQNERELLKAIIKIKKLERLFNQYYIQKLGPKLYVSGIITKR